jgi:hypothetical protein
MFVLAHPTARRLAKEAIDAAPDGHVVVIREPSRSLDQSAAFHAICSDIAKSKTEWFGKTRTAEEWKVLLVSAHSSATKQGHDMVQGLEGELVQLRESTARMSKARASSLIEYCKAWAVSRGIQLRDGE